MEQLTSKQQDSGKTDSSGVVPHWHQGPKELTRLESLRRQYKKLYGFKPCGWSEKAIEQGIQEAELKRDLARSSQNELDPQERATIGDALERR